VDRRRITLALTARGRSTLAAAREATQKRLAERLEALPDGQLERVMGSLRLLRTIFASAPSASQG
jgi:DNA-binding MarR family transcriptional regulator